MNRIQKISWLMVISTGIAVVLSSVAVGILYTYFGFPKAGAGFAFLAIAGIGGLGPIIFKKDPGTVTCDERDRAINSTAAKAGFGVSYLLFGVLCMGFWEYFRAEGKVPVEILPLIWIFAGLACFFVHALTILILYGRDKTYLQEIKCLREQDDA